MTDMGETMGKIEQLAGDVFRDLGDFATNGLIENIEQLRLAAADTQMPEIHDSLVFLGQIAVVAQALNELVPGGIAAAEAIGNHARYWKG